MARKPHLVFMLSSQATLAAHALTPRWVSGPCRVSAESERSRWTGKNSIPVAEGVPLPGSLPARSGPCRASWKDTWGLPFYDWPRVAPILGGHMGPPIDSDPLTGVEGMNGQNTNRAEGRRASWMVRSLREHTLLIHRRVGSPCLPPHPDPPPRRGEGMMVVVFYRDQAWAALPSRWSSRVKVVPLPTSLSTVIRPLWSRTMP